MLGMMWLSWVDGMAQSKRTWGVLENILAQDKVEKLNRKLILSL
jgi:hypothetical protein